jgi:hypothetical protein
MPPVKCIVINSGNLTHDGRQHRFSYSRVVKDPISGQGLQEFWAWFEK